MAREVVGFASQDKELLKAAREATEGRAEPDSRVAVVFATMWLESYVNGLLERLAHRKQLPRRLSALVAIAGPLEERRAPLTVKIQLFSFVLTGSAVGLGTRTWQDLELLLAVRNQLVHARPASLTLDLAANPAWTYLEKKNTKEIRQGFIDRGFFSRGSMLHWSTALNNGAVVGIWALGVVDRTARMIADFFPRGRERTWAHSQNPATPQFARKKRRRRKPKDAPAPLGNKPSVR